MKKILMRVLVVFVISALLGLAGCYDEDKGPMQTAGEKADNAVEKGGEAVKTGAEKTGNAVKKAGEKTKDAVDDVVK